MNKTKGVFYDSIDNSEMNIRILKNAYYTIKTMFVVTVWSFYTWHDFV